MKDRIGIKEIDKLSELSALEFNQQEKEELIKQVGDIIEMLKQCDSVEIDVTSDKPTMSLRELREDEVKQSMKISDVLLNAPKARKDYFNVPKVVE